VRVEFEAYQEDTPVIQDSEAPTFDCEFKFGVEDKLSPISLTVYDKDAKSDEAIGKVQLPITQGMLDGLEEDGWLELQPLAGGLGDPSVKKAKSRLSYSPDISRGLGEVRIACTYTWPTVSSQRQLRANAELGLVHCTVIGARGLPKMDRWSHTDSYAQIQFGDTVQKTEVEMDTETPQWQQTLTFEVNDRPAMHSKLVLGVYDKDEASGDDVIGEFPFTVRALSGNLSGLSVFHSKSVFHGALV
jgi:Ca2+-dependent lipid-binding protein